MRRRARCIEGAAHGRRDIASSARELGFNWRGEMGILDKVGEIAGAVAAVEGAEKLDPNAGFLTKAAAAVAGFEGAKEVEQLV